MSKIERFLINLGLTFEEVDENTWIINDEKSGLEQILVFLEEPLIIIRINVTTLPDRNNEEFYKTLLILNANDLVHGAYAISDNEVILIDTLQYETIDIEEFQASLDSIGLAMIEHYPILSKFR
jgi:hypothetical protein